MGLRDLIASQSQPREKIPETPASQPAYVPQGPYVFTCEVATDYRNAQARFVSPEVRLSDWLNGSTPTLEVDAIEGIPLSGEPAGGIIGKSSILFAAPLTEPERPHRALWQVTAQYQVWSSLGPYEITGTLHLEVGLDPVVALRVMDRVFVPITEATVHHPSGVVTSYDVIFINRSRAGILALGS